MRNFYALFPPIFFDVDIHISISVDFVDFCFPRWITLQIGDTFGIFFRFSNHLKWCSKQKADKMNVVRWCLLPNVFFWIFVSVDEVVNEQEKERNGEIGKKLQKINWKPTTLINGLILLHIIHFYHGSFDRSWLLRSTKMC